MTFDIDNAYAFLYKSSARQAGALLKKAVFGQLHLLKEQVKAHIKKEDPFDTYQYIADTMTKHQHQPYFFILMGGTGGVDRAINYEAEQGRHLLGYLDSFGKVGLHPSFASNDSTHRLSKEKEILEDIISKPVNDSRQHFIKLSMPDTYRRLAKVGITNDYSMGYASFPGFRAGIATPFPFFDLERNEVTALMVHPFVLMDATYKHYAKTTPEQALANAVNLIRRIKEVNGYCNVIFHNESLSDWHQWKGWRMFFDEVIEELFYER